MVEIMK